MKPSPSFGTKGSKRITPWLIKYALVSVSIYTQKPLKDVKDEEPSL